MYIFDTVQTIVITFFQSIMNYLPSLLGGLIILCIGLILSQIVRKVLVSLFSVFRIEELLQQAHIQQKGQVKIWQDLLIEFAGWAVVIMFLVPASEVWGLTRISDILNTILYYIPNVLVAVVIAFVGLVISNLVADLVRHSVKTVNGTSANSFAALARYAIVFFTILIVLNQLGVAQDLIRILFTGIVAMIAIAGGLAFGLGGKETAKELLEDIKKTLS